MTILRITDQDNVGVAIDSINAGDICSAGSLSVIAQETIPKGHKIALQDIDAGQEVIKYGYPIGQTTADVKKGGWLHSHNLTTCLVNNGEYQYQPTETCCPQQKEQFVFKGYRRNNGKIGVRNEIWIIPTVGCVNRITERIAYNARNKFDQLGYVDGIYGYTHPYGCSQLGADHVYTQKLLAGLVNHPNAAGVLVVGLGCENNNVEEFKRVLGDYEPERIKFLIAQEVEDEIACGLELIDELVAHASQYNREDCPMSELVIGLKCGGSDGFSGITANPLVGAFSDVLVKNGGSTILTEVPEMFGAETILMNRARTEEVFKKCVDLINNFKRYYEDNNQPIYENPSPGNKIGGITTLEEKSLGCIQKGGRSAVVDVLDYAGSVRHKGLNLLSAPGNDLVAATALVAAGCHIILFTTGRGTPLGTAVPTIKIATNTEIFVKKPNWMDFDAGVLLDRQCMDKTLDKFISYVMEIASGTLTRSEEMGSREIAIFKTGVTL